MAAVDSDIQASGGDYTTTQAWHSAVPSTPSGKQRGLLAAEEFVITASQSFNGKAASSGSEVQLICQAGASWTDIDPFVGWFSTVKARLTADSRLVNLLAVSDNYTDVIGVQLKNTGTGSGLAVLSMTGNANCDIDNILADTATDHSCFDLDGSSFGRNCLAIVRDVAADGFRCSNDFEFYNCLAVVPTDQPANTSGQGFTRDTGTPTLINCASFGFNLDFEASGWDSASNYNASDSTNGTSPSSPTITVTRRLVSTLPISNEPPSPSNPVSLINAISAIS